MNWEAALLVVVPLVVCAELYSMRETLLNITLIMEIKYRRTSQG